MIIIHAMDELLARHVARQLKEHLATMPAVVVTGARQTGKSTLAQAAAPHDTGLALHIAGVAEPSGAHLENLVLSDLLAWRDARPRRTPPFA